MTNILITGSAGFIGYHLVKRLLKEDCLITGIDNISDYYDINLKYARLAQCGIEREKIRDHAIVKSNNSDSYRFIKMSLLEKDELFSLFENNNFDYVINLAAQPGVRYSIDHPEIYIQSNIVGFANILEACRHNKIRHLVFASSSSVYGANKKVPFSTMDFTDSPVSLYGATKKSNELMAHAYSCLFNLPVTGLRFFTVYGPWGRPDMSYFLFTKAILNNEKIKVFNHGEMQRDFTYIDDIVEALGKIIFSPPENKIRKNTPDDNIPYKIYNIGNSRPVKLEVFIGCLEELLGKKAVKEYLPMQDGDLPATFADIDPLIRDFSFSPSTNYREGLEEFVKWFLKYNLTIDN